MANKQLTATVRLNTTQAERKIKNLARAIDALNRAVGRHSAAEREVTAALGRSVRTTSRARAETERWASSAKKVNTTTKSTNSTLKSIGTRLSHIAGIYAGMRTIKLGVDYASTITGAENRLNNIEGGNPKLTAESMDKIYAAAQRSRSGYTNMLSNVSKTMALAGDSFQNNVDNAIRFQEIMAKAYTLGGASTTEAATSMYQLVQALGSGVLQGDELRSVREGAPIAYKEIEKFAQKVFNTEESLKDLASQGVITSDIIVAAIMGAEKELDTAFKNTKMTFTQAWDSIKNQALKAFTPVLQRLTNILNSTRGQKFLEGIGDAFVALANGVNWVIDVLSNFFSWCAENWELVKTIIVTAIIVITAWLTYMAVSAIINFIMTNWVILLICAALVLLIYILHKLGYSTGEIVGGICGVIMFLAYLIQDIIVWVITILYWAIALVWDITLAVTMAIAGIIVGLGYTIIAAIQGVIQLILWAITTVIGVFVTVYNIFYSLIKGIYGAFKAAIVGIYQLFVWLGQGALSIINWIAKGIDAVFGSNLSSSVEGWIKGLGSSVDTLAEKLDPLGEFKDIGNQWKDSYSDLGDRYAGRGKYDDWNIVDNMVDTYDGTVNILNGMGDLTNKLLLDPTLLDQWALDNTINPMDGWNKGYDFGNNFDKSLSSALDSIIGGGLLNPNDPKYGLNNAYDPSGADDDIKKALDQLNGTTSDIKDSMDLRDDDLEFLRKVAEMEWRNEFTTAEIKVDMTNNNTVNGERDLDGIVEYLADALRNEMASVAEGVHY